MVSEVIPVFSRKVLFGYEFMAAATDGHRLHQPGRLGTSHVHRRHEPDRSTCSSSSASLLVSIPTGHQVLQLAGHDVRRADLASPRRCCSAFGFLSMFLIGGLTGIMLAAAPFDFQLSDSYFVVGHFHWVLIGGTLFGIFAGIHYWYPKVTGRMLSERLARWQFWLLYIGFILTFGPMHVSGMLGMPRRIYTYDAGRGWEIWNQLTTLGAIIQVPSFAIFVYNVVASLWQRPAGRRRPVGRLDAGVGDDLAAALVQLRDDPDGPQPPAALGPEAPGRPGLAVRITGPNEAAIMSAVQPASDLPIPPPIVPERTLNSAQWGMASFLLSEVAFFCTLIVAYVAFMGKDTVGPTPAEALSLPLVIVTTICLLSSSVVIHFAERSLKRGQRRAFLSAVGGNSRPRDLCFSWARPSSGEVSLSSTISR